MPPRRGLDDPPEVTVNTDLATTDQHTIDPRLIALQRLHVELSAEFAAVRDRMDRLENELNKPLSDYLTEAGVQC
jgi:hypothetical protein